MILLDNVEVKYLFELRQRWLKERKLNIIELSCMLFCLTHWCTSSRSDCKLSLSSSNVSFTPQSTKVSSAKLIIFDPISVLLSKIKNKGVGNSALWKTTNYWLVDILTNWVWWLWSKGKLWNKQQGYHQYLTSLIYDTMGHNIPEVKVVHVSKHSQIVLKTCCHKHPEAQINKIYPLWNCF